MGKLNWNVYKQGNSLVVNLNGGVNAIFDMTHPNFEANKAEKKAEIEQYATFRKTVVKGMGLLE